MLCESDVHAVIHCVNFAQAEGGSGGGVVQYASPSNPSCVKCKVT